MRMIPHVLTMLSVERAERLDDVLEIASIPEDVEDDGVLLQPDVRCLD